MEQQKTTGNDADCPLPRAKKKALDANPRLVEMERFELSSKRGTNMLSTRLV